MEKDYKPLVKFNYIIPSHTHSKLPQDPYKPIQMQGFVIRDKKVKSVK